MALTLLLLKVFTVLSSPISYVSAFGESSSDARNNSIEIQFTKRFEAAFQGDCRDEVPCQQLCYDLHDGTFECGCKPSFTLFSDGYTCIENTEVEEVRPKAKKEELPGKKDLPSVFRYVLDSKERMQSDEDSHSRTRHDPRARTLSQSENRSAGEFNHDVQEPFLKAHLEVTKERKSYSGERDAPLRKRLATPTPWKQVFVSAEEVSMSENSSGNSFESWNPSTVQRNVSTEISCNCFNGGTCISTNSIERCRCPLGWSGTSCQKAQDIRYPRLERNSYLTLYYSTESHGRIFRIELEFRPELYEGLLLSLTYNEDPSQGKPSCTVLLKNGIVEMRYSDGKNTELLRSERAVLLNSWNRMKLMFTDTKSSLLLNDDSIKNNPHMGDIFSKMSGKFLVFLGIFPNWTAKAHHNGFQGCIRRLDINNYSYAFGKTNEDVVDGADIEECRPGVCNTVSCQNGGQCTAVRENRGKCLCPLGFGGDECTDTIDITVPSFDGTGHLQFPGLASSSLTFTEILLVFLPRSPNGALLYNGYRINGTGDFISLTLNSGHILFKFDLGTGINVIKTEKTIKMHKWHKVLLTRTGRLGSLRVDDDDPIYVTSKGGYSQLSLPLNLYIGGVPSPKELASAVEVQNSFVGCIQKLVINGKSVKLVEQALSGANINDCDHICKKKPCSNSGTCIPVLEGYSCKCSSDYTGPTCNTEIADMVTRPMFMGTSYLHYVNEHILARFRGQSLQLSLAFRALSPFGLILWAGSRVMDPSSDYFVLGLYGGHLRLDYNLGSGPVSLFYNHSRVDDGYWHEIKIVRFKQRGSMTIDETRTVTAVSPGPLKELNIPNELFLGGMPDMNHYNVSIYETGLMGCLSSFTLDANYRIQFLTMAVTGINIQPCV